MKKSIKRVAVTGAAGQIAYSLVFRIAKGDVFGIDQPVSLHLLDLPDFHTVLQGVQMELQDCAFDLLKEVRIGSSADELFEGIDAAFLVGAKPRSLGMERKDLLADNGKIFVEQGKALNKGASKDARILVVGNPANTNCLIALHHAPNLNPNHFFAMTRLDQNRAVYQLAAKANAQIAEVTNVVIWGNHSATQVPDFLNAKIRGRPAQEAIQDRKWLEHEFIPLIQKRGAEVIRLRGKSSAASAGNAAVDAMHSLFHPTPSNTCFSAAVYSKNNPYGIDPNLVFSFPCKSKGEGDIHIVSGFSFDSFLQEKIHLTQKELVEERDCVAHLLG